MDGDQTAISSPPTVRPHTQHGGSPSRLLVRRLLACFFPCNPCRSTRPRHPALCFLGRQRPDLSLLLSLSLSTLGGSSARVTVSPGGEVYKRVGAVLFWVVTRSWEAGTGGDQGLFAAPLSFYRANQDGDRLETGEVTLPSFPVLFIPAPILWHVRYFLYAGTTLVNKV